MATIQIQSVGRVKAKPAIEFKTGEKMVWCLDLSALFSPVMRVR